MGTKFERCSHHNGDDKKNQGRDNVSSESKMAQMGG